MKISTKKKLRYYIVLGSLLLESLLLVSCRDPLFKMINSDEPFNQNIDYHPQSFDEAWQWIDDNITYVSDPPGGNKKHPEETYQDRCGDCEDFALLLAYFGVKLGYKVTVIACRVEGLAGYHAICRFQNKLIEPQIYNRSYKKEKVTIIDEMRYEVAYFTNTIRSLEH